ncbi:hypothetical protein QE177_12260 [Arsenophonus sp. aPb]|uniref:hypothetical protein n=1 Tax=Arsenophonus sp. aPb TaxID=3041619 RepID=UPI002468A354|nr:hypothetical protein [Arsenophonus sp. aPb]WGL97949.1 hypothetical protein QE177_12260 [Arsenophonus sp. aPb]
MNPLKKEIPATLAEHIDGIQSYNLIISIADTLQIKPDPLPSWWKEKEIQYIQQK